MTDQEGRVAHHIVRADGRVLSSRRATAQFYAASTVKLAVLAALAREVAQGTADLADTLPSQDTFSSVVDGAPDYRLIPDDVDHGMPAPGEPMTLAELARRMIVISSNEATNILFARLGQPAVGQVLSDAGAEGVSMGRQYGDFAAAKQLGPVNLVSAAGLTSLMSAVITGRLCPDPNLNAWMIGLLEAQEFPALSRSLPAGVRWGSKSGSVDGVRHDFAFFGEPGPDALVVAVCTSGYEHEAAGELITAIGAAAYGLAGV
ncbi:serine hydrolase [Naumannella halotolerans]|uniref:Beta-lactamase class A n=1 Tax=Naumannella halotolerans TaxID=993414 RepID=A0A4R7JAJ1_9ACTN|nr:serine hydrolase [Naumannella halotolerans]TDT33936.1 beta-lactamase class A [Naumannella halotolerans]